MEEDKLQQLLINQTKIMSALGGDEFGNLGLVERQKIDDQKFSDINDSLNELKDTQQLIIKGQELQQQQTDNVEQRLSAIEDFYIFFRTLTSVKKKTIVWLTTLVSTLGALIAYAKDIAQFIKTNF